MQNIVLTLVFSSVMLLFMAFPAMRISEFLTKKFSFSRKIYNFLILFITVSLSLLIGAFLRYF